MAGSLWDKRQIIQIKQHIGQILAILALQGKRRAAFGRDKAQAQGTNTGGGGFGLVQHLGPGFDGVTAKARIGMGAAFFPRVIGEADPLLRRVGGGAPEFAMPMWLLTHEDLRKAARIRILLDFLGKRLDSDKLALSSEASVAAP